MKPFIVILALAMVSQGLWPVTDASSRGEARVAVFIEPGFYRYGGSPSIAPERLVDFLQDKQIDARALSVRELSDPDVLNAKKFSVLVLVYGNSYPKDAGATLRVFHQEGGCLVLNGIPFTHPCVNEAGKWRSLGGPMFLDHGKGMGTGSFVNAPKDLVAMNLTVPGNPLGFTKRMVAPQTKPVQGLVVSSLDRSDEVLPLLTYEAPTGPMVVSALIRHQCEGFRGARDVWIGQASTRLSEDDDYTSRQLIGRGTAWCLLEKKVIDESRYKKIMGHMDQMSPPGALPEDLEVKSSPRVWGPGFLPRAPAAAETIDVLNLSGRSPDERVALTCLQGLVARKEPALYFLVNEEADSFWLTWHLEKKYFQKKSVLADWKSLFQKHRALVKGAIVPDTNLYRGEQMAANIAACEDYVVASPELARDLGLEVKMDLRGRWKTWHEGTRWIWNHYRGQWSRHLATYSDPGRFKTLCNFDVLYQWRGLVLWPVGAEDRSQPGADQLAEIRLMADILAGMDANSAFLGFPSGPKGGLGEVQGVELISRYGVGLVCTDLRPNLSLLSSVRAPNLKTPLAKKKIKLDRSKIYIAMVVSDGDNLNVWQSYHLQYFTNQAMGGIPLAFGMGPAIADLAPGVAAWFFEHAGEANEFIADVSGISYMQPQNWGLAYRDREAVWDGFLTQTRDYMKQLGMGSARTVRGEDDDLLRYARALPFCHSLFADMGRYSGREGIKALTYSLPMGMPVFRAVTSWRYGKEGFLKEVKEQVGAQRPAFVNGFLHNWTFKADAIAAIEAHRDPDMVFVTPSQLAGLYQQEQDRP